MKYWITTDTHFEHNKMGYWCGRPDGFEEKLLKALAPIQEGDVFIHLGDIAWFQHKEWHKRLWDAVGTRHRWLAKGNHDRNSYTWYLKQGWSFVGDSFTVEAFGHKVLFSHTPKPEGDFTVNVHGHFHNNPVEKWERYLVLVMTDKHLLVAMENTHYQPVRLQKLLADFDRK